MCAAPWVPTPETTYQEYVARGDLCGGIHYATGSLIRIEWTNAEGKLHRGDDLPAEAFVTGALAWYKNGDCHRSGDRPADVSSYCTRWFKKGQLHRLNDEPSVVYEDGTKVWYTHGKCHRENDLPARIRVSNGTQEWWKDGLLHREGDLPALCFSGTRAWYLNGKFRGTEKNPPEGAVFPGCLTKPARAQ